METEPAFGYILSSMENCDLGARVVRHPLYRFGQMCGIITSAMSLFFFGKLFWKKFFHMGFHFNIKCILVVYYINAVAQATLYALTQSKQFFLGFILSHPCDFFLNRPEYIICHLINLFLIQYQLWLLVAMWLERCIATIMRNKYEHRTKFLGPLLTILVTFPVFGTLFFAYWDEPFTEPSTDHINSPLASAKKINDVLIIELVICVVGCLFVICLRQFNNRQLKRTHFNLQTQYQLTENVAATRFILRISVFTILCYIVLFCGTLAVRLLKNTIVFKDKFPLFQGMRNITYVLPLFTLFLPLISDVLRTSDKNRKQQKRVSIVEQSTVRDPGSVYNIQLERQWKAGPVPLIKFPQRSVSVS